MPGPGASPARLLVLTTVLLPATITCPESRAGTSIPDEARRMGVGVSGMWESHTGLLLLDYYEAFLKDRDLGEFRDRVSARYTEATLGRVLSASPSAAARRAAVLALGVMGSFAQSNAVLARALRDTDPVVRAMADSALWTIWFRADSPENNRTLQEVRLLIGNQQIDEAVELAGRLIASAPRFAEAFNQRAIARFIQGRFAESAEDCQRVLQLNPYHFGALSGLAQCQLQTGKPREALQTLRRLLKLQPYSPSIRQSIQELEAQIEPDGPR
jgi:tetratricopeptide (TPR) repeat protein